MSYEGVIGFWQKVSEDKTLQDKIAPKAGKVPLLDGSNKPEELKELSNIAKSAGFDASAEELAATEAVMRFWGQVTKDMKLQERLKPAQSIQSVDRASAEIARIAGEVGYSFTGPQVNTITALLQNTGVMGEREMSDKQLDSVVGGSLNAYSLSYDAAISGKFMTSLRKVPMIGPGGVSQYM
jgi:hypothetical protein